MTPQELREMRRLIIDNAYLDSEGDVENIEDILNELEILDKASTAKPTDQFYSLVNEIDDTRKLLNAAQGNPTRIVMVLDMITAVCVRYAEMLEKERNVLPLTLEPDIAPCSRCKGKGWLWNVDAGFACKVCNADGHTKP